MMRKPFRIFLFVATWWMSVPAWSQHAPDMVYLKGGSWIRGQIMEQVVGSHVILLMADGTRRQIPADSVERLVLEEGQTPFVFKKIGFINATSLGFWCGQTSYGPEFRPSLNLFNGIQMGEKWMAGLGTGVEIFGYDWSLPVYGEGRFHLGSRVSPFVGLQGGYRVPLPRQEIEYIDFPPYVPDKHKGGWMTGLEIGVRNTLRQHFGYTISFGYRLQTDAKEVQQYIWDNNGGTYLTVLNRTTMHRFGIRFGFLFN